jgi:aryl-alcohol dehydrogenase-like predicted oxidoreductase
MPLIESSDYKNGLTNRDRALEVSELLKHGADGMSERNGKLHNRFAFPYHFEKVQNILRKGPAFMERRAFGDSGVSVSAISLGCWIFGVDWWGHYTDEAAVRLMQFARDQGITFFDNGDAYGNGRAETLLGKFLQTAPRDQIEIGGKFGYDFYSDPGTPGSHRERKQDFSPKFMRFALEQSLKRLNVDVIDLYMAHNIKLPQFNDELFAELEKVKDEGKIRAWGVSLGPAIGWREEGIKAMIDHHAKAVQTVYNLFEQARQQQHSQG